MEIISTTLCVRFRLETPYGIYEDAVHLPQDTIVNISEVTLIAEERAKNWLQTITNTPPLDPPTVEDLTEQIVEREADIQRIQEKIELVIATQSDTEAPTVPQGLRARVTSTGIQLAWDPSRDDVAFGVYEIFRDGEVIDKTPKERYTDFDAPYDTRITYYIVAYDQAGNSSERSEALQIQREEGATVRQDRPPIRPPRKPGT